MFIYENILVSDEVFDSYFVCDLGACKGACCVEGEGGAPLEPEEIPVLEELWPTLTDFFEPEGRAVLEAEGAWVRGPDGTLETPLVNGRECAYLHYTPEGIATCGLEVAYNNNRSPFRKPVSCHLYPIRAAKKGEFTLLYYHKWGICNPACTNGAQLRVPLYQFAKAALIRAYGEELFEAMEAYAAQL